MVKPGPLEVILNSASELVFEVCEQSCNVEFVVCFEGAFNNSYSTDLCDSKCGFYVNTDEEYTTFMNKFQPPQGNGRLKLNCTEMVMLHERTIQKDSPQYYASCLPKVESGFVKLYIINATSECVISIKNAKIKQDEIIATPSTNSPSNNPSAAANISGNVGWIFVLVSLCIPYY